MIDARKCPTRSKLPAWTETLSEAHWLQDRRVTGYSRICVTIYAAAILIVLALSPQWIDPGGKPVGTDFLNVWTAGRMALQGRAADAYNYDLQFAMEQKALSWKQGQIVPLYAWHYPPMFMIVASLLALLPYGAALAVWMAVTLPVYLAAIWSIMPGRKVMLAALAFPAVLVNLSHGQNGFVTAGLLGGALVLLERRPWISGVLFGLLAYKPQFALIIPLALALGGCWRAILAAAVSTVGTVAMSWAILGGETWRAFFASLKLSRTYLLEQGAPGWEKLQSLFAAVRMFGGSIPVAYAAQAAFAAMAAAGVVWIWSRKRDSGALRGAALATATLMITPYVLDYDLIVLALPIAWLAHIGARDGFLRWEKIILLAAWLLPLLSRMMGSFLHLPLAPFVMALLFAVILRRAGAVAPRNRTGTVA